MAPAACSRCSLCEMQFMKLFIPCSRYCAVCEKTEGGNSHLTDNSMVSSRAGKIECNLGAVMANAMNVFEMENDLTSKIINPDRRIIKVKEPFKRRREVSGSHERGKG